MKGGLSSTLSAAPPSPGLRGQLWSSFCSEIRTTSPDSLPMRTPQHKRRSLDCTHGWGCVGGCLRYEGFKQRCMPNLSQRTLGVFFSERSYLTFLTGSFVSAGAHSNGTEPRGQAVFTAEAVQTSEILGVLAVFEVLQSLKLHDESSFCNTGTRIPVNVWT